MFYENIRIKQGLPYISFCPLKILYNSKFILMATSLGTNDVVVTGGCFDEIVRKQKRKIDLPTFYCQSATF